MKAKRRQSDRLAGIEPQLLTEDVARVTGMSRESIAYLCRHGQIRGVRLGKRWLIPRRELERLLDGKGD